MRTQPYELAGKNVPEALRGQVVQLPISDNVQEAASQLCENGEDDVNAKFNDGNVIRLQGRIRDRAAKALKDANGDVRAAISALQGFASSDKYGQRAEGSGPAKPKTAKGVADSKAKASGNRLFEKCAQDATLLARMVKQGIVDEAEFAEWQTATAQAKADAEKAKAPAA